MINMNKIGFIMIQRDNKVVDCSISIVGSAPSLEEELSDISVKSSQKVTLKCKITAGDPKSKITWYFKDKEVKITKKMKVSYENEEAVLTINDAELSNAGSYRCEASNKLGRVETQCTLTVNSK
jgi:hemicentin